MYIQYIYVYIFFPPLENNPSGGNLPSGKGYAQAPNTYNFQLCICDAFTTCYDCCLLLSFFPFLPSPFLLLSFLSTLFLSISSLPLFLLSFISLLSSLLESPYHQKR